MNIPGHLAVAVVQHRALNLAPTDYKPTLLLLAVSLLPDVVDKAIGYIFKLMPNGRHYAHNLFSLIGSTLLVGLIAGRQASVIWSFGYMGHLFADSRHMIPWLFPFKRYHFAPGRGIRFHPPSILREVGLLISALLFHWYSRR